MKNSLSTSTNLALGIMSLLIFLAQMVFGQTLAPTATYTSPLTGTTHTLQGCSVEDKAVSVMPNVFVRQKKPIEQKMLWSEEREKFEYDMLKDPATGLVPRNAAPSALQAAQKTKLFNSKALSPGDVTITPRGPNNLGGRTRAIEFDKRNANIILAGGVSSGAFRTTNGGTSWTRVTPIGQIHNVTAIAQDPRPGFQDTWYYGGGESIGNSASLGSPYRGFGIWKSTDNGVTWTQLPSTATGALEIFDSPFDYTHRIVVNPTNGHIYAAAGNSIQRSTDGGTTWAAVLGTFSNANSTDVIITPAGRIYASFLGTDANEGVWTSVTGNSGSWVKIAGTVSMVKTPATWHNANTYGRVVLAYAPSDTNTVFALYWNGTTSSCTGVAAPEAKLFKYNRSTTTWTDLSANLPDEAGCSNGNDPFAVQGGYDLVVTVKPNDVNTVFIGGTNLYRSTNGFTSTAATTRIGGYASTANYALYANHHPDQHVAIFAPGDNNTLYSGHDGGIHKADITTPTVAWTSLNNDYVTYQYYHVDIDPVNGSTALIGGAQDNGTTSVNTGTSFSSVFGGDGCATGIISYTNTSSFNVIGTAQSGSVYRFVGPSMGWFIRPIGLAASIFVTYLHLDQDNRNYLYFVGGSVLYRTRIASTITGSSSGTSVGNPTTGWDIIPAGISGNIRSIATSRNDAFSGNAYTAADANRKLYIGTETGRVYRLNNPAFTTSAAVEITPLAPIASSGVCSSIAVNPENDNEIIVTFSNYGVNSVYHTLNANVAAPTWTVVEGPAAGPVALGSARSSIIAPIGSTKTYFVGNSTGLYAAQALSGATTVWEKVGTNDINYALCSQIRLRKSDNKMVVGTHGNGMFDLQLPVGPTINTQPTAATICENANTSFSVAATGAMTYQWQVSNDNLSMNFTNLTIAAPYSLSAGGATLNITSAPISLNGKYYRCIVSNGTGYTNSNGVILNVAPPTTAPTAVAASTKLACSGSSVTLTATCATGTITWYNQPSGGTALGTGNNLVQNPTTTTTYYASCENSCLVSSRVATEPVTVSTLSMTPLSLSTDLTSGNSFQITTQSINATHKITPPATATYRAGTSISFNTGFEAQSGAVFLAEIRGCN